MVFTQLRPDDTGVAAILRYCIRENVKDAVKCLVRMVVRRKWKPSVRHELVDPSVLDINVTWGSVSSEPGTHYVVQLRSCSTQMLLKSVLPPLECRPRLGELVKLGLNDKQR